MVGVGFYVGMPEQNTSLDKIQLKMKICVVVNKHLLTERV